MAEETADATAGGAQAAEAGDSEQRFINDVMNDNAEFDHHAGSQPFVPDDQAAALLQIFDDPAVRSVLQDKLGARFEPCAAKLETWRSQTPALGAAIGTVVVELAADHLRPTGMLQRLRDGVEAASFGVGTLLTNLPAASDCAEVQ
jgi:hypothetical protein